MSLTVVCNDLSSPTDYRFSFNFIKHSCHLDENNFMLTRWNSSQNYRTYRNNCMFPMTLKIFVPTSYYLTLGGPVLNLWKFSFIIMTNLNNVTAVHCPIVPQRRGLTVNTQSTKMNTKLKFSCINGNSLIGAEDIVCLPSGNWSAPFPVCESE